MQRGHCSILWENRRRSIKIMVVKRWNIWPKVSQIRHIFDRFRAILVEILGKIFSDGVSHDRQCVILYSYLKYSHGPLTVNSQYIHSVRLSLYVYIRAAGSLCIRVYHA